MSDPTLVNGQITDAVAQVNVGVLASAPAQALATDYQTLAQSVGLQMQNAVAGQRNLATLASSITTQAANLILTAPVGHSVRAANEVHSRGRGLSALEAALAVVLARTNQ